MKEFSWSPNYTIDDWSIAHTIEGLRGIDRASLHAEMQKREREKNVLFWEKFIPGWKLKNSTYLAQEVSFNSSDFEKFRSSLSGFAETLDGDKQRINEIQFCDGSKKKRKYLRISGDEESMEAGPRLGEERPAAVQRDSVMNEDEMDAAGEEKQGVNPA